MSAISRYRCPLGKHDQKSASLNRREVSDDDTADVVAQQLAAAGGPREWLRRCGTGMG